MDHPGTVSVGAAEPDDQLCLSVTSIISAANGGSSDGLVWWARRGAATIAVNRRDVWAGMTPGEASDWIARRHEANAKVNRDNGSTVHDALEQWALTGTRPAGSDLRMVGDADPKMVGLMLDQADAWLQQAQPDYLAAELTVYSPTRGYAGTLDAIARVAGVPFLIDYKTHYDSWDRDGRPRRPYPEQVALQLVAYQRAEWAALFRARRVERSFYPRYYALSAAERDQSIAVPPVEAGLCVYITPEHCHAYPVLLDDRAWRAFLHAIDVYRWLKHDSKSVMGQPLDLGGDGHAHHRATAAPA